MESIFAYTDYRRFLKEYVLAKKREGCGFSYKVFADRAGFKARDYLLRVINGSRNLSQSGIFMVSRALRLSEKEADYFANLVAFNQAAAPREKEYFYRKMVDICKYGQHQRLRQDQFEYLSEWYYGAIRSLLPVMDFKDDCAALGKFLDPPLAAGQVRKSVALLRQLGLIVRHDDGTYSAPVSSLTTGDEVASMALLLFHRQSLDLARRALDLYPSTERDISGVTMSLSQAGFDKVKEEAQRFRKRVLDIAAADSREERAFQLNIQLFPLSKRKTRT